MREGGKGKRWERWHEAGEGEERKTEKKKRKRDWTEYCPGCPPATRNGWMVGRNSWNTIQMSITETLRLSQRLRERTLRRRRTLVWWWLRLGLDLPPRSSWSSGGCVDEQFVTRVVTRVVELFSGSHYCFYNCLHVLVTLPSIYVDVKGYTRFKTTANTQLYVLSLSLNLLCKSEMVKYFFHDVDIIFRGPVAHITA